MFRRSQRAEEPLEQQVDCEDAERADQQSSGQCDLRELDFGTHTDDGLKSEEAPEDEQDRLCERVDAVRDTNTGDHFGNTGEIRPRQHRREPDERAGPEEEHEEVLRLAVHFYPAVGNEGEEQEQCDGRDRFPPEDGRIRVAVEEIDERVVVVIDRDVRTKGS